MKTEEEILVEFLQNSLAGKLDPSAHLNPGFLASAIIAKLDFNRPLEERNARNVNEAVKTFAEMINEIDKDMDIELEQLGEDEKMVKNFIQGQKTACQKLLDEIKKL